MVRVLNMFFVFKPETAYEMRIGDWSSDVCSSDLVAVYGGKLPQTVTDDTPQRPTTSYGNQKLTGELLINDYSSKGFFDGRAIRLPRSAERRVGKARVCTCQYRRSPYHYTNNISIAIYLLIYYTITSNNNTI